MFTHLYVLLLSCVLMVIHMSVPAVAQTTHQQDVTQAEELINAGQLDLAWAKGSASVGAIINAPYLGQTAGSALAATLLGE